MMEKLRYAEDIKWNEHVEPNELLTNDHLILLIQSAVYV